MQSTGTTESNRDAATGGPSLPNDAGEPDSGLHDIRSLASSTKARLSSRRSSQNPMMSEDDILASSSAGWKAVALPEPAKMLSLPELAEPPSAKEVKDQDKAANKAKAAEIKATTEAAAPAVIPTAGPRIAAKNLRGGKGKTIAFVGLGLAAAAGVAMFFAMTNKQDSSAKEQTVAAGAPPAGDYMSTPKMPPAPPPAIETAAASGSAATATPEAVAQIAAPELPADAPKATKGAAQPAKATHKVEVRDTSIAANATKAKDKTSPAKKEEKKAEGGDGEPSFDALLKEAGVSDPKKDNTPKLDKKSLSGGDIKSGMSAVAGKAAGCYQGTQGTVTVKLTVAPSGQVAKVSVSGVFAGTPVAACVVAAVKSASFPPWDGGPQSFGYSYLLSE